MLALSLVLARALSPALGVLLGLLGFATRHTSLLGWPLFVGGVVYAAAAVILGYVLRRDVHLPQDAARQTRLGAASFWLFAAGMTAALCLPPLEHLYLREGGISPPWLELIGAGVACLAGAVVAWARVFRRPSRPAALVIARGGGVMPSRSSRSLHRADYAACVLVALGLVLGYASMWGAAALLLMLVPGALWRMQVEDRLRASERPFGEGGRHEAVQ